MFEYLPICRVYAMNKAYNVDFQGFLVEIITVIWCEFDDGVDTNELFSHYDQHA